jgi:hypothetical protein
MKKSVAVLMLVMMTVGFDWGLSQRGSDIITITVKNQFPIPVDIQVNDDYAGKAAANSSFKVRVNVRKGAVKIVVWAYENPKIIASRTFANLAPGQDVIWATGDVELNFGPVPIPPQAVAPQAIAPTAVSANQAAPKAPAPSQIVAHQAAPDSAISHQPPLKGADVSYVTSVTTLNYQGPKSQFLAKRTSRAEISRQKTPGGATYTLSGEGGMQIGREGKPAFYKAPPIVVNRSLPEDMLSNDKAGLNKWFAAVNLTMSGLTQKGKHIRSGTWEDSIVFPEGDGYPKTIRAQFWARPLPKPDDRWILITVDSGLLSFQALDQKYENFEIQGRYRGILVYEPAGDTFLESAGAFTLYHGEDRFRIEQIQVAADAEGNQLLPVPDMGDYLDFAPKGANSSPQGSLPSWCAQSAILFNLLHMASMSAAEGATNSGGLAGVEQWLLDLIEHDYTAVEKVLGRAAADQLLGDWMKLIDTWRTGKTLGFAKALWDLGIDHAKDLILAALPYNMGLQHQILGFTKDVADATIEDIDAGVKKLAYRYSDLKYTFPPSAEPVNLATPKDEVKKPAKGLGPAEILIGVVGGVALAYALDKYVLGGSTSDTGNGGDTSGGFPVSVVNHCSQNLTSFKVNGTEYGPINAGATKNFSVAKNGSCTTIKYSWTTSLNFSYDSWGKYKTSCGFIFTDNFQANMAPLAGVQVSDCN